ncbi:cytokine receptor [Elysia marginata]|uniref:Cytokine receptor n=1 Tax=Elysia marginata TaxID=1093978 RepID=A0AAV4HJA9_9GAST|nr:cytokine receptor [Elysia marginata]
MSSSIFCMDLESFNDLGDLADTFGYLTESIQGDSYVFVGSKLKLKCTLPDNMWMDGWSSKDISFYHSWPSNHKPDDFRCLEAQTSVDSQTSASVVVENVTLDDAGTYTCYVGRSNCSRQVVVGIGTDVFIEYPPHNVTNLICIVRDWTESMKCTWAHPVEYVDAKNMSVTLAIDTMMSKTGKECPHLTKTSCEWRNRQEFLAASKYYLQINVTNSRTHDVAEKLFTVETLKSVQPSPVTGLNVKESAVGCAKVTWSHRIKSRWLIFRVRHRAKQEEEFQVLANVTGKLENSEDGILSYTKCGLDPMTSHEFAVDCYPGGVSSGYWSRAQTTEITTAQTAPDEGPQITEGSYLSGPCSNGKRTVTLHFNDVREDARNGIITTVSVMVTESGKEIWRGPSDQYFATFQLGCERVVLQLFAHNKGGKSKVPSQITIPSADATGVPLLLQESFSVEMIREGNITTELRAVWHAFLKDGNSFPYSLTAFWCKRNWPLKECMGPIFWQLILSGNTSWPISANITDATDYLYGISLQNTSTQSSSQIFWTNCLYDKFSSYVPAPSSIELEPGSEEIKVRWSPVLCSYTMNTKVDGYIVKWQKDNSNEVVMEETVPNSVSSYSIEKLQADTPYLVTVQSKSSNQLGQQAAWMQAVTFKKTSSSYAYRLSIGLSISISLLVVFKICFLILFKRYCQKKKKVSKDIEKVQDLGKSWRPKPMTKSRISTAKKPYLLL